MLRYEALTETGICILGDNRYSITMRLSDIDYQLATPGTQENIIEQYARFLNSFDAGQSIQISVINRYLDQEALERDIALPPRGDGLDNYRRAMNDIIKEKLAQDRNNTITDKYVTITITAESYEQANTILNRIEVEAQTQLMNVGGCRAERVSGEGRITILQNLLRPHAPQTFTYEQLIGTTQTTKDYVAPLTADFSNTRTAILTGQTETHYQTLILRDLPTWMSDRLIRELTDINTDLAISIHLNPMDQTEGLELVKRQIASMNMQRVTEQRKLIKQGLTEDLMPHELVVSHEEATDLLRQLESSNEKLYTTTILVGVRANTPEELHEQTSRIQQVARKQSTSLEPLRFMQEDALNAILPLGRNDLPINRTITTAVAAILIPFTTQEILDKNGIYYGVNDTSKNLILGNRGATMNGNAFFLGTSGSGKSYFGKSEITQVVLGKPNDEIIIIDPEREYWALGDTLGATTIEVSADATQVINPLEISKDTAAEGSPIKLKAEFVLSMCEVLFGGVTGLTHAQRSVLDRVTTRMYNQYWATKNAQQPTLVTLYELLRAEADEHAHEVAAALELYATGTFNGFAQQTNVDTTNRFTIYDTSNLGEELQTFGMLVVLEQIWAQVAKNRAAGKRTWVYVDEFHLYFTNDYAASYFQMMWKRLRKWGGFPTGITQNIEELLISDRARLMLANSAVLALLDQTPTDAEALQNLFGFSDRQREKYSNVPPGRGLLKFGTDIVPFDARMPTDNPLYQLFSTKFTEANQ